jgi:hypothetical protein
MSTLHPDMCELVFDPPTALFKIGHLYPELIIIGLPQASLRGSSKQSTKVSRFFLISSDGVLSILYFSAVSD